MVLYRMFKVIDIEKENFSAPSGVKLTKIIIDERWPMFRGTWWKPWTWRVGWGWQVRVGFASDPREAG